MRGTGGVADGRTEAKISRRTCRASGRYSTYLHLPVNWLEIKTASQFIARPRAEEIASEKHYFRWMYRTVPADWPHLEALFREYDIIPVRPAERFGGKQV
jgi:hypothetical protein